MLHKLRVVDTTAADKHIGGIDCEILNRRANTPDGQRAKSCLHICRRNVRNIHCLKPFEIEVFEACALGGCRLEIRVGEETGQEIVVDSPSCRPVTITVK